jgi:hypothetical protein
LKFYCVLYLLVIERCKIKFKNILWKSRACVNLYGGKIAKIYGQAWPKNWKQMFTFLKQNHFRAGRASNSYTLKFESIFETASEYKLWSEVDFLTKDMQAKITHNFPFMLHAYMRTIRLYCRRGTFPLLEDCHVEIVTCSLPRWWVQEIKRMCLVSLTWFIYNLNTMFIRYELTCATIHIRTYFYECCPFDQPLPLASFFKHLQPLHKWITPFLLTWRSLFWWSWCECSSTLVPG